MNGKHGSGGLWQRSSPLVQLLLISAFVLAGIILGQVLANRISYGTGRELQSYLESYVGLLADGREVSPAFFTTAVLYFRYPLIVFTLGFLAVGIVLVPCIAAAYGFTLSFSVACMAAAFGPSGVALAAVALGLRTLLTLPCFLALAAFSWESACSVASFSRDKRAQQGTAELGKQRWICFAVCMIVLLSGVFLEMAVGSKLLSALLGYLLG